MVGLTLKCRVYRISERHLTSVEVSGVTKSCKANLEISILSNYSVRRVLSVKSDVMAILDLTS